MRRSRGLSQDRESDISIFRKFNFKRLTEKMLRFSGFARIMKQLNANLLCETVSQI